MTSRSLLGGAADGQLVGPQTINAYPSHMFLRASGTVHDILFANAHLAIRQER